MSDRSLHRAAQCLQSIRRLLQRGADPFVQTRACYLDAYRQITGRALEGV